jgi:hypothetical protein
MLHIMFWVELWRPVFFFFFCMEDFGPRGDPSVDISKYLRNGQENVEAVPCSKTCFQQYKTLSVSMNLSIYILFWITSPSNTPRF